MKNVDLKYYYERLGIAEKLIALNVVIFILDALLGAISRSSAQFVLDWFILPTDFFQFLIKPWTLLTYSFLHSGFSHLFRNMIVLYFTGQIFLNLFNAKRFLNVYFLGVILGGAIFLFSYNVFPALLGTNTSLLGASAGVTAVLIFVCAYLPNQEVRLLFFNVKLWYIGIAVILWDLFQISMGSNIGGHLAHLGGAVLGYYYAKQLLAGHDIGAWFGRFMDRLANLFKGKEKQAPLKTVYRKGGRTTSAPENYDRESHQRKIDAILDKISKSGYESLSKAEKDFLFKAGKE